MRRLVAAIAGAVALLGPITTAHAATPRVDRVWVFSVPTLAFGDVTPAEMPNLHAFLQQAAVADLSNRVDDTTTSLADAYATLGAGSRTRGARTDPGWGFGPDEVIDGRRAGEVFQARTGTPSDGQLVYLAQDSLRAANRDALFGAEIGALGDALARAGRGRAVIANADAGLQPPDAGLHRGAITVLSDSSGRVPDGVLAPTLLTPDPQSAFGVRLDIDAVDAAVTTARNPSGVVVVEASDLWRAELARQRGRDEDTARRARVTSDALFARLLTRIDAARDAVLVVGPRSQGSGLGLTIAALRAPGTKPGFLESATTRRAGFVQLVDVAPTVLSLVGVEVPDAMEGRPFVEVPERTQAQDRLATLIDANDAARFRDRIIGPVTTAWTLGQVLLLALTVWVFVDTRMLRARRMLAPAALGLLAAPLGFWLAGPIPFFRYGVAAYGLFVVLVAGVVTSLATLFARRTAIDPLLVVLGALVTLVVLDVVSGAHLQFNTVFGYSPTIAGRFAGIGNLAYSILGAAAIFLAGLLAYRVAGRWGRGLAAAVLAIVCLVDGLPFFGADVGGMLSLIPASVVLLWLLAGRTIRIRTVVVGVMVTMGIVFAVGMADLARPSTQRTHLGRLFERVGDQGWSGLWVVLRRKAEANLGVLGLSIWTVMIPVLFILLAIVIYRAPGRLREIKQAIPELRATLIAFGVLAVLGFALNDSGIAIPGVMLGVANSVLVYLCIRVPDGVVVPDHSRGEVDAT